MSTIDALGDLINTFEQTETAIAETTENIAAQRRMAKACFMARDRVIHEEREDEAKRALKAHKATLAETKRALSASLARGAGGKGTAIERARRVIAERQAALAHGGTAEIRPLAETMLAPRAA